MVTLVGKVLSAVPELLDEGEDSEELPPQDINTNSNKVTINKFLI